MDWRHYGIMALLLVAGYYAGTKYPGLITKATMGKVQG